MRTFLQRAAPVASPALVLAATLRPLPGRTTATADVVCNTPGATVGRLLGAALESGEGRNMAFE